MKKEYLFLVIGIILFSLIFVSFILFSPAKEENQPVPSNQPTAIVSRYPIASVAPTFFPPKMKDLPYLPQGAGGGIDRQSNTVKVSTLEINKLTSSLPYQSKTTLSNGTRVEILIPAKDLQLNEWTLTVQIFGIDYQVEKNTEEYQLMKNSFLEAANTVFGWMVEKGANPENIIISWGDRAFIQNRAEEWLAK